MRRLLFYISLSLLILCNSCLLCSALSIQAPENLTNSIFNEQISSSASTTGSSTSSAAPAAPSSPYAIDVNDLYYAVNGTLPSSEQAATMEAALAAANAPTDAGALAAVYNTNAAVKSVVDSICPSPPPTSGSAAAQFVTSVFQNVTGGVPSVSALTPWITNITSGQLTPGNAVVNILASLTSCQYTILNDTINNKITAPPTSTTPTTTTVNTADTADSDTQNIVDQELTINTGSNTFLQWAQNHPVYAATLIALAVGGIVAIAVAVPLGVHELHIHQHDVRTTNTNNQTAAIASYLNYVKSQQKAPVMASTSPY